MSRQSSSDLPSDLPSDSKRPPRWITVANRLPFTLSEGGNKITTSSGGLVSALSGVRGDAQNPVERIWIGTAPDGLTPEDWPRVQKVLEATNPVWQFHPVFVPKELYSSYYNGTCNDVLWPLLHYQSELVEFDQEHWQAYREVNERIAREINEVARDGDLIWIHDFHLFLLPKILKALRPNLRVGFFLHVPFPSSEIFRQLPVREEILDSLLAADLIGFHDYSYLQHFCTSVLRLLGVESEFLAIHRGGRSTRLGVFPVSIDTEFFQKRTKEKSVQALAREIEKPMFTFMGVDRLDYMKGLDLKLKAFRKLLQKFPDYREKVRLVQIAVPTRQGVPVYAKLASDTAQLVGEINGEFSTPNWSPIHYIHSSVDSAHLLALYRSADALLVNSKRDGMNLVALEFIASQDAERPGVVILSEFAGASSTLSHALSINPWDLEATARQMQIAMEMPRQEKLFRVLTMQDYLHQYTATDWAESFIEELEKQIPEHSEGPKTIEIDRHVLSPIIDAAWNLIENTPERATLFLDYDGTLVPIEAAPELAVMTDAVRRDVEMITSYPWLDTMIVSGRDSRFLERQFAGLPVAIAAEHGAKVLEAEASRWQRRIHRKRSIWYPSALKIMGDYASRVPGSQIEKKHFSIAWHYRQSPTEYGEMQARKLAQELELGLANLPVSILRGKKVIEVRAIEADKGVLAAAYLESVSQRTLPIAIGDDRTDEDLFRAIKGRGLSIKVGTGASTADYAISSQPLVLPFLKMLLDDLDKRFRRNDRRKHIMIGQSEIRH
jgi:trehalose 6-phosphate synthase/phosphatase